MQSFYTGYQPAQFADRRLGGLQVYAPVQRAFMRFAGSHALHVSTRAERPPVPVTTTARNCGSRFEFAAHAKLAAQAGVPEHLVEALRIASEPAIEDQAQAIAYAVARELLTTQQVSDACCARALQTLSEAEMIELVVTIGYYSTVSMVLNTFDIPLGEGMSGPSPED